VLVFYIIIISLKVACSRHDIPDKTVYLALKNNDLMKQNEVHREYYL